MTRKAQGVGEIAEALRVGVGQVDAEGVEVVPAPAQLVVGVDNLPRRVQVVAEYVVNAAAAADDRDRWSAQPDVFLDARAVCVVFADQVTGFVVNVDAPAYTQRIAGFADALAQRVGGVVVDGTVRQGNFVQPVAAVVTEAQQAVVGQVAGVVIVVDIAVDAVQSVTAGFR